MMHESTERPRFEVRCRTSEDTLVRVGPIVSQADAIGLAWRYLGDGRAVRAEIYQNRGGDLQLRSIIGQPNPRPPALPGEPDEC